MNPIEHIEDCANRSIRRALGFALLAIWTFMVGLSAEAQLAVRAGAILCNLAWLILIAMSWRAPGRPYRRTEVWLMLDRQHDLPEARAQATIGGILSERYRWHAGLAAGVAGALWLVDFALLLIV
ncbi:MAG: hypothetical protein FJX68_03510 [Alphaproteobacteria bacterium]|nr:hypothetical protein [Alphaproteobacteria bacterium]